MLKKLTNGYRRFRQGMYRTSPRHKWILTILATIGVIAILAYSFGRDYEAGAMGYPKATSTVTMTQFMGMVGHQWTGKLLIFTDQKAFFEGSQPGKPKETLQITAFMDQITKADYRLIQQDKAIQTQGGVSWSLHNPIPGKTAVVATDIAQLGSAALTFLFYGFFMMMMYRQTSMMGGQTRFNTFHGDTGVRFDQVAGMDAVKQEISEVVDYLRDKSAFTRVGARAPRGVLLYGPPGNGKTMLAKAVAGECGVPFIEQNGGNVMGKFLGESSDGIKKLFKHARQMATQHGGCIIFMDEIEAIGSSRWSTQTVSHDEKHGALDTLLAEMDGFGDNTGIVLIGATNRLDVLDPALLRPGRFDRKVYVPSPGKQGRAAILRQYITSIPAQNVDVDRLAAMSPGFSGADIAHWINEAAIQAARRNAAEVTIADFLKARDIIVAGPENTGIDLSQQERGVIAWHEAGHAEVRHATDGWVDRVSILPRGQALGVTFSTPGEIVLHTQDSVRQELMVLLAGRAAEDLFVGKISAGAANDLERASAIAFEAVTKLGLGDRGLFVPQTEAGRHEAEQSAANLIRDSYEQASTILRENRQRVQGLHDALMTHNDVDYQEFIQVDGKGKEENFSAAEILVSACAPS